MYALLAVGLIAIYSVRHIVNLAQGEFASLGGLGAVWLIGVGIPVLPAIVLAVVSVTAAAVLIDRLIIARVRRMTTLISIILTLGIATLLQALMLLAWGPTARGLDPFPGADVSLGGVSIRSQEFWMLGTLAVVGVGIIIFSEHTRLGKAMRAVAEQPTAARIVGISPALASAVAFGIAGLTGALAGVASSPLSLSVWSAGLLLALKGFVAAVLGGLVSYRAAIVGGLLLGVLESYVAGYVASGYRDAVAFLILIVVLIVRPGGLVRRPNEARV